MKIAAGELRREALKVFRRLKDPDHFLQQISGKPSIVGLFGPRNNWQRPVMTIDVGLVRELHRADFLLRTRSLKKAGDHDAPLYVLSAVGEAWWRRQSGASEPFQAQHQLKGTVAIDEPGRGVIVRNVNLGESPLGWLRSRKGKGGKPYLGGREAEAGERIRRDYTLAQLTTRTTVDWDGMLAHVDRSYVAPTDRADLSSHVLDARRRVEKALEAVGPGLADVLVETCCHLSGLEQAERTLGWPQRSGKIVLKIALSRLAEHYDGKTVDEESRAGQRVWHAPLGQPEGAGQPV